MEDRFSCRLGYNTGLTIEPLFARGQTGINRILKKEGVGRVIACASERVMGQRRRAKSF